MLRIAVHTDESVPRAAGQLTEFGSSPQSAGARVGRACNGAGTVGDRAIAIFTIGALVSASGTIGDTHATEACPNGRETPCR